MVTNSAPANAVVEAGRKGDDARTDEGGSDDVDLHIRVAAV